MNILSYVPEESLGFMTITTNRLLSALLRRKMREAGLDLSGEQWGVLVILWDRGELPQEELIQLACMDKTGMSRLLTQLENKGLIARCVDAANARRKLIQVTEKAQALRAQADRRARSAGSGSRGCIERRSRRVYACARNGETDVTTDCVLAVFPYVSPYPYHG